jgi:hypothetical protein
MNNFPRFDTPDELSWELWVRHAGESENSLVPTMKKIRDIWRREKIDEETQSEKMKDFESYLLPNPVARGFKFSNIVPICLFQSKNGNGVDLLSIFFIFPNPWFIVLLFLGVTTKTQHPKASCLRNHCHDLFYSQKGMSVHELYYFYLHVFFNTRLHLSPNFYHQ